MTVAGLRLGVTATIVSAVVVSVVALDGEGHALARTFAVNDPSDLVDASVGDGQCRTSAGTCTLRAAVQETNALPGEDVIQVPAGTYGISIPPQGGNGIASGDLDITDSVTIRGAGASSTIVDGGNPPSGSPPERRGLDRLFEVLVDGGSVSVSGLTLSDGYASEYGGAILNSSSATVTITSSTLRGSTAGKTGGAIDNHVGGTVRLRNTTVTSNYAVEGGSGINNNLDGLLELTDSVVSHNSGAAVGLDETLRGAGAISNNAEHDSVGTIIVTGSQIIENDSGGGRSGAGISNDGAGTLVVDRTTFSKNRSTGDGGAIFNGTGDVTVTGSTFLENAGTDGGAIASKGGIVTVLDSSLAKNRAADWGGGISIGNVGGATIRNTSFSENTALNGGGVASEGTGLVTVEDSTFTKNAAVDTATAVGGEGGGLHSNSGGEVVVSGGSFSDNRAYAGGGFSNEGGGTVTITGTHFSANFAEGPGGGVLVQGGDVRMVEIDVVGNVSDSPEEGGGGISYAGDKSVSVGESAAIESSLIRDNKAKGQGGGIDSRGDGPLVITTTAITGNSAFAGGAIHHVGDATLAVTRSTLSANVAEHGGGVLTDGDGEATIENSTVSGNRAGQFGGGLLVSSRLVLRNSTVANNLASSGGGINNGGGELVGDGSVWVANSIVANNPAGGNCVGTITSRGGNVENSDSCQFRELTDQPGTDPRLGILADNGGTTQTHSLLVDSPAQDTAVCTDADPCPPVDQRGAERPKVAGFDVGAYESELLPGGGTVECAGRTERPVLADYDSWVSQSSAGSNFGSDGILKVESQSGSNERALVHFTLPTVPPGCELVDATLRLYASAATDGRTLQALRVASGWSESEVTWNNQPGTAGSAATTEAGLGFREWNVLAQTLEMYSLGSHGFLIRDAVESVSGEQSFHSTEKGVDRPPELVLVFDDPDGPPREGVCPDVPQLLTADGDSWVSEGSPSNNFGSDSTLKVKSQSGSNSRALVRFELPRLPPGCTTVSSAILRLDASSAKERHTLQALQIASSWAESGVTWRNQPATTGPAATAPSGTGPVEWDVTSQTLGIYVSGNHGYLIRDAAENGVGDEQTFASREKGSNQPELVFAFDDSTPETMIDTGPLSPTDETEAVFTFSSDRDDATFECSLDGAAFDPCTSPHTLVGVTEGNHRFEVRSTRRIRAVDPTPASHEWTVVVPPETTLDGPASLSDSSDARLTFSSDDPDATFECLLDGVPFADCTSPVELTNLVDGPHEFRVQAIDPFGNVDPTPPNHFWTVAVPPETTIDSGPPDPTNGTSPRFHFTGSDNTTASSALAFECRLDSQSEADFVECSSPHSYADLAEGSHAFELRATDRAGNTDPTPATFIWTIDTTPPETTIDEGPADPTSSASATLRFSSEPGSSFQCSLDAAAFTACPSPASYTALSEGSHTFRVEATDRAGNTDPTPATYTWTVDATAPETTIDEGPADPTTATSATFLFSSEPGSSFQCSQDGAPFAACTSPAEYSGLGEGSHTFRVRATDRAGNMDATPATYAWAVDTTAPETTIDEGPADPTNSTSATFAFSSEPGTSFECSLDAAAFTACTSPAGYTGLAEGAHTFRVRATDRAGNTDATPATYAWAVDTTAPETTIDAGPADPTSSNATTLTFSASESGSFECRLDGKDPSAWSPCSSPQSYADLAEGSHTFEVRATDRAGNTDATPATHMWTVDTTAPETTIDEGPADPTTATSATFLISGEPGSSLQCSLDAAAFTACTSPASYTDLAEGSHTFEVRATDRAGNTDATPATHLWTVDTTAPETTIDEGPADPTTATSATFTFSGEPGSSFQCSLDGVAFTACTSPAEYGGLNEGSHTFQVRATDRAGNTDPTPASHTWTIQAADTAPPQTTIDSGPAAQTTDSTATFTFSANEAGATFACALDGAAFTACTSPAEYGGLGEGSHTFQVRATDRAGNTDATPAGHTWTIQAADTAPPQTTIDSGPAVQTADTAATFTFSGSEPGSTFACALDGTGFTACTSPAEYSGLTEGSHTFQVRATDRAGNTDATAAAHTWTIDTTPPATTIDSGPDDPTAATSARFVFSSEAGSSFQCSLDTAAFAACTSPAEFSGLSVGSHTFQVKATDRAGNMDASPASHTWTIQAADTAPPQTTIDSGPAARTTDTTATFTFSASEAGSTFACALDGAAFTACTSPRQYSGLAQGSHTFQVRATDRAGNTDPTPASHTWTVSASSACPSPTTTSAAQDAWIDQNSPTNNKGTDSILKVQSKGPADNFRALVRFNLPTIPQGCVLDTARLRLYAASASGSQRTLEVYRIAGPWMENGVTWANAPLTSGAAATTTSGSGYREWNVAALVQAMLSSGSNHGFLIKDGSEGQDAEQQFHAREKGSNVPQLVLTFKPAQ